MKDFPSIIQNIDVSLISSKNSTGAEISIKRQTARFEISRTLGTIDTPNIASRNQGHRRCETEQDAPRETINVINHKRINSRNFDIEKMFLLSNYNKSDFLSRVEREKTRQEMLKINQGFQTREHLKTFGQSFDYGVGQNRKFEFRDHANTQIQYKQEAQQNVQVQKSIDFGLVNIQDQLQLVLSRNAPQLKEGLSFKTSEVSQNSKITSSGMSRNREQGHDFLIKSTSKSFRQASINSARRSYITQEEQKLRSTQGDKQSRSTRVEKQQKQTGKSQSRSIAQKQQSFQKLGTYGDLNNIAEKKYRDINMINQLPNMQGACLTEKIGNQLVNVVKKKEIEIMKQIEKVILEKEFSSPQILWKDSHKLGFEKNTFNQHLDVEKVLTGKCNVCVCYKMKDKRFIVKELPRNIQSLQNFINEYGMRTGKIDANMMEEVALHHDKRLNIHSTLKFMDSWMNCVPLLPLENIVQCYGIIEQFGHFFVVSDLIQDIQVALIQQKPSATKNKKANKGFKESAKDVNDSLSESEDISEFDSEQKVSTESLDEKDELESVSLTENSEEIQQNQKLDTHQKEDHIFTFYGERCKNENLSVSLNVYHTIAQFKMGNLTNFFDIPKFYSKFLLKYIIDVSQALSHAHSQKLVHGCLDLSRVIFQRHYTDPNLTNGHFSGQIKIEMKHHQIYNQIDDCKFWLTSFEPFRVFQMLQDSHKSKFKNLQQIPTMQLSQDDITQIVMTKDLQSFATSIIDVMLGKVKKSGCYHGTSASSRNLFQNFNGSQVTLDMIPVIWSKNPEISQILKILRLLLGPYERTGNTKVDTVKILNNVSQIAERTYEAIFFKDNSLAPNILPRIFKTQDEERTNILRSHLLNDQAVFKFHQIQVTSPLQVKQNYVKAALSMFHKALKLNPKNQCTHLNLNLLLWQNGMITEQDFSWFLKYELVNFDQELAILMFLLFKKAVLGFDPTYFEYVEAFQVIKRQSHLMSNAARFTLAHPDFTTFINKFNLSSRKKTLNAVQTNFLIENRCNRVIDMDAKFQPEGIFFSNNDQYVVLIGKEQLLIIDSVTGSIEKKIDLPGVIRQDSQSKIGLTGGEASFKIKQMPIEGLEENSNNDEKDEDEDQSKVSRSEEVNSLMDLGLARQPSTQEIFEDNAEKEKRILIEKYPSNWQADISPTGNVLALFDKAQQERNMVVKYKENVVEEMIVYTIILKSNLQPPNLINLNMLELLDRHEVMNFNLEGWVKGNFSVICVQAKDLYIYVIDFEHQKLLQKIADSRQSISQKSIFSHFGSEMERNQQYFESAKEFIADLEAQGKQVRLPKYHHEIMAVKQKDSNMIYILNIKSRRLVQKFKLNIDIKTFFEENNQNNFELSEDDDEDSQGEIIKNQDLIALEMYREQMKKKRQDSFSKYEKMQHNELVDSKVNDETRWNIIKRKLLFKQELSRSFILPEDKLSSIVSLEISELMKQLDLNPRRLRNSARSEEVKQKVQIFDLSPNARFMASVINNKFFVKVLNHAESSQKINNLAYQLSIPFLPLYLDTDFKRHLIQSPEEHEQGSVSSIDYPSLKGIKKWLVTDAVVALETIISYKERADQGLSGFVLNDKMIMIKGLVEQILLNPDCLNTYVSKLNDKEEKIKILQQCYTMVRAFHELDEVNLRKENLRALRLIKNFNCIEFKRADETVQNFVCSQCSQNFLMACVIDREIHVYNYMSGETIFKTYVSKMIKEPSQSMYKNTLDFIDSDEMLMVQTCNSTIKLISVNTMKKNYRQIQNKFKKNIVEEITEPGPVIGCSVQVGFGVDQEGNFWNEDFQNEGEDNVSDHGNETTQSGFVEMEVGITIKNIFVSDKDCKFQQIGVTYNNGFKIYFVYEDFKCSYDLRWDNYYFLQSEIMKMGNHQSLEFDKDGERVYSATDKGYMCIWSMVEKVLTKQFVVFHPVTKKPVNIQLFRNIPKFNTVAVYSKEDKSLLIAKALFKRMVQTIGEIVQQELKYKLQNMKEQQQSCQQMKIQDVTPSNLNKSQGPISLRSHVNKMKILKKNLTTFEPDQEIRSRPVNKKVDFSVRRKVSTYMPVFMTYLLEYNQAKGFVLQLKIERGQDFLVTLFQDGSIIIYNNDSFEPLIELPSPAPQAHSQQIFIDEYCTFLGVRQPLNQEINFYLFDWVYNLEEFDRAKEKNGKANKFKSQLETKRKATLRTKSGKYDARMGSLYIKLPESKDESPVVQQREEETTSDFEKTILYTQTMRAEKSSFFEKQIAKIPLGPKEKISQLFSPRRNDTQNKTKTCTIF